MRERERERERERASKLSKKRERTFLLLLSAGNHMSQGESEVAEGKKESSEPHSNSFNARER